MKSIMSLHVSSLFLCIHVMLASDFTESVTPESDGTSVTFNYWYMQDFSG